MVTVSLPTTRSAAAVASAATASSLAGAAAGVGSVTRGDRGGGESAVDALAGRREFLNYCLSLMRAHNGEHSDTLPVIDVSSLKHIAYVFDALIYYMRSGNECNPYSDSTAADDYLADLWNDQVISLFNY